MSLDEYKIKEEKSSAKEHAATSWGTILISALVGFMGGFLALSITPTDVTTNSDVREVVLQESEVIADIVEDVSESVVSINVTSVEERFNPFFGSTESEFDSEGTGIILTNDGLVVTNKHVIPESATSVEVVLSDGTVYEDVTVVGRDPFNDIAYLQIKDVDSLQPARLGESKNVRAGDRAIAIGNALGEFETTVTSGIISGVGRPIVAGSGSDSEALSNLFQTDASINPGNSGGPLLNISGEVIGINTAVAGGGAENIGFAIPIDDVKSGITSVKENGELIRPYLGVSYVTLNKALAEEFELDVEQGAFLYSGEGENATLSNSPAEKAGLETGDIIIEVEGIKLDDENVLPLVVGKYQVGETIDVVVLRDGEEQTIEVTLERAPEL